VEGALVGAVAGRTGGASLGASVGIGAGAGAVGSAVGQAVEHTINGTWDEFDGVEFGARVGTAGLLGGVGSGLTGLASGAFRTTSGREVAPALSREATLAFDSYNNGKFNTFGGLVLNAVFGDDEAAANPVPTGVIK